MNHGPVCGVRRMLTYVGEDHGAAAVASIIRTLKNARLTSTSIHKALESRVTPSDLPSVYCIQRHRTGRCGCPREGS